MIKTVELLPTYRCNLNCKGCYEKNNTCVGEITHFEIAYARDQVNRMSPLPLRVLRLPYFWVIGGEVFLRNDIYDILADLNKTNRTGVQTNGTMADIKRLMNLNLSCVMFSIDGLENSNDAVRGKGVFKKAYSSIKQACKLKGETKVSVNIRVMKETALDIPVLVKDLKSMGVDSIQLGVMTNITSRYQHSGEYTEKILPADLISMYDDSKGCVWKPSCTKEELIDWYWAGRPNLERFKCGYSSTLKIAPYGDVIPCMDKVMGNIRKDSIEDIWNSAQFRKFRDEIKSKLNPQCAMCCNLVKI